MPSNSANGATPAALIDRRHLVLVLFPGTKLLDVTGPLQVFHDARSPDDTAAYRVSLVSEPGGTIITDTGVGLDTLPLTAMTDERIDILLVSGGSSALEAAESNGLLAWLAETAPRAARLGSVCMGAFILARGGLLSGRRAVTHWAWCAALAAQYPDVSVEPDAIYVVDNTLWTSAGVSAGIDMALGMVELDLGRSEALRLARSLVLYLKRPGGQSQFSASLERQTSSENGRFDTLDAWIRQNVASDLSVRRLAEHAAMSERTFARRYRQVTGLTPASAVEMIRVDVACDLLSHERRAIKQVALAAGFGTEEKMRRAFQRRKGISPAGWRTHFGGGTGPQSGK